MMGGLRIVVAPVPGRVHLLPPRGFSNGAEVVRRGQLVAEILAGGSRIPVNVPVDGVVDSVLVLHGVLVGNGHPILVIRPEDAA